MADFTIKDEVFKAISKISDCDRILRLYCIYCNFSGTNKELIDDNEILRQTGYGPLIFKKLKLSMIENGLLEPVKENAKLFEDLTDYHLKQMNISVAYTMIKTNSLKWVRNLHLNNATGTHSEYVDLITWWFGNFPLEEKKILGKEYGGIRFDYITKKFIDWISKPTTKRLQLPYNTLRIFYQKQLRAPDYNMAISIGVDELAEEIKSNTAVWKKTMCVSQGRRDNYEFVMYWWFRNIDHDLQVEINKTFGVEDVSKIAYKLYLELKANPKYFTSFYECMIKKLNWSIK